jgi:formylglycine-generating enzyme required for sulfatase activity
LAVPGALSAEETAEGHPQGAPKTTPIANPASEAKTAEEMKPYRETIPGTEVGFDLVVIPGGKFTIGSPGDEADRNEDEGPQREIEVAPFWMGRCEVTWDEYDIWSFSLDIQRRQVLGQDPTPNDKFADVMTRPTRPYTDMTFGMGKDGYPAICMTQLAAKCYCEWLTAKTGRFYRLPTEAEWEYACRAGSKTAYHFGDDAEKLDEYAWHYDNSEDTYQKVGKKKPNAWGLHDMHGNVSEWVLDAYEADAYKKAPLPWKAQELHEAPTKLYPRVVRGGSWDDDPEALRSAVRRFSEKWWKSQDPQIPQSIWYHTDALFVGFRVVRPLEEPSEAMKARYRAQGTHGT